MEHKNYNGFRSKTVNIRTYTGSTKFNLQKSNELGLPEGSIVVGIMVRQHSTDKKSSNNKELVPSTVFENAYLTLKSHKASQGISTVIDAYYLPFAIDRTIFFEPIDSKCLDWNESFISINKRALPNLVTNSIIELTILYRPFEKHICTLDNNFIFRTGQQLLGTRRDRKELELIEGQTEYPLSASTSIGLPAEAWIVGFTTRSTQFPLRGEPMDSAAFNSAYLTFKRKTDSFIDSFPIELEDYQDTLFPALDYFPMEPMKVLEMDWTASLLDIKNVAGIKTGQVFQIEFVYVMADDNRRLSTSM